MIFIGDKGDIVQGESRQVVELSKIFTILVRGGFEEKNRQLKERKTAPC
jgi:hypothetical protein